MTRYWKAFLAFIAPGVVLIGAAVTEGSQAGEDITQSEVITALVAMIVTAAAVAAGPKNTE